MDAVQLKTVSLKFAGIAAALHALKAKRPWLWAAFLALHPVIRGGLHELSSQGSSTAANAISLVLLYRAALDSAIPKDYVSLYFWLLYIFMWGKRKLMPAIPARSSPLESLKLTIRDFNAKLPPQTWLKLGFAAVFGQLLSHYLAHPASTANVFLNDTVRTRIFNPVWLHHTAVAALVPLLSLRVHTVLTRGIVRTYIRHNAFLFAVFAAILFSKAKALYDQKRNGIYLDTDKRPTTQQIVAGWLKGSIARANSVANLVLGPSVLSMILLTLTTPALLVRASHASRKRTKLLHNYVKLVGFVLALATVCANHTQDSKILGAFTLYLFRLIVLSNWRVAKASYLKISSWNALETAAMSAGVFTFLQLKDKGINDSLVKLLARIM